mgnify:FL=1
MEDLYVVIANFGRGQQSLWPRMRDSRSEGAPIFGDADPNTSSGISGLYTKKEADAIVSDNSERGYGAPHYHAKSLAVAHEFAQGLAGNLIRQVQQRKLREMKTVITKKRLKEIIKEEIALLAESDYQRVDTNILDPETKQRMFKHLISVGVYKPSRHNPDMIDPFSGYTSTARKALDAVASGNEPSSDGGPPWSEMQVSQMHTQLNNMID